MAILVILPQPANYRKTGNYGKERYCGFLKFATKDETKSSTSVARSAFWCAGPSLMLLELPELRRDTKPNKIPALERSLKAASLQILGGCGSRSRAQARLRARSLSLSLSLFLILSRELEGRLELGGGWAVATVA